MEKKQNENITKNLIENDQTDEKQEKYKISFCIKTQLVNNKYNSIILVEILKNLIYFTYVCFILIWNILYLL